MATAEITVSGVMGGGAPVYQPPKASDTLTTTTTTAEAVLNDARGVYTIQSGDYVRVMARGAAQYVAISKSAQTDPRVCIADGATIDIGPLAAGDTINVADVA